MRTFEDKVVKVISQLICDVCGGQKIPSDKFMVLTQISPQN